MEQEGHELGKEFGDGPGLLESAYEACVCRELELRGLGFERQVPVPVLYRGLEVDCAYRIDVIVEGSILLELKAVDALSRIHAAQVITYLKLAHIPVGLLVNFNVPSLRTGLRRFSLSKFGGWHVPAPNS